MTPEEIDKRVSGPSDHSLGRVVGVVPGMFLLRTNDGHEHWLSQECVYTIENDHVTLICEREGLERYVVDPSGEPLAP